MEEKLVENWNGVVGKNDTTYILGDFCWSRTESDWIRILDRLNGSKVLIQGNHDLRSPSATLKSKFQDIKPLKEITDGDKHVIMCHYPMPCYRASYNANMYMLYGHVHCTKEDKLMNEVRKQIWHNKVMESDSWGNLINVGCMKRYMNYTPQTIEYLANIINKEREAFWNDGEAE